MLVVSQAVLVVPPPGGVASPPGVQGIDLVPDVEVGLLARQASPRPHRKQASTAQLTAADLMSWPPVTVSPDADQVRYVEGVIAVRDRFTYPRLRHIQILRLLRRPPSTSGRASLPGGRPGN